MNKNLVTLTLITIGVSALFSYASTMNDWRVYNAYAGSNMSSNASAGISQSMGNETSNGKNLTGNDIQNANNTLSNITADVSDKVSNYTGNNSGANYTVVIGIANKTK